MLERFQQLLKDLKNKQDKELIPASVETLEGYFKMQDTNKWLKFNATTKEQLQRVNNFENNLKKVFATLSVPDAL